MGASRVSNKDLLDAISSLPAAIATALAGMQVSAAPAVRTEQEPKAPVATTDSAPSIRVSKEYLANRKVAAQAHANKVGAPVVLYARRNLQGETKLAFAIKDRFDVLKDNGLIGPVESYLPQ